ncbi:MAG: type VI secretion system baseplate subunit TssF [Planctomycetota bacterium]
MFNKYYQDELIFMREMGREFSLAWPEAAPFLAEPGADPDVERMLEGFAFLTARIRQKLDDELPELTHALLEMFWPHYLRPIPSMTIVQFTPTQPDLFRIPRGTELESTPVDGTPCRFRTAYEVPLVPMTVGAIELRREAPAQIRIRLDLPDGLAIEKLALDTLRFHLSGDSAVTRALYLALCRYGRKVSVQTIAEKPKVVELPDAKITPVGLGDEHALLIYEGTSFPGYRLLQEYFAYPAKLMFVDIKGLGGVRRLGSERRFELVVELERMPENMPPVSTANLLLNCTPAVNLFKHDADPIRVNLARTDYKLRPAGADASHFEVYSINTVTGREKGTAKPREYRPLYRLSHLTQSGGTYYRAATVKSVVGDGTDLTLTFVNDDGPTRLTDIETVSIKLTCTNRNLPTRLAPGDLSVQTSTTPTFATYKNLARPVPSIPPPLGGDIYWRLLSHLTINYLSLLNLDSLRGLLELYNFRARVDRQAENTQKQLLQGIESVESTPGTRMLRGTPVRGINVALALSEDNFGSEGELYLFGTVMNEFLSQYVSLNSFSSLTVRGTRFGEVHKWPPRLGRRNIL